MSWTMYRWVWRVVSPLHIGMPPAGALNRTQLYVPARTIWGAVTAELARRQSATFPDYQQVGQQLQQDARFSYLFPAEKVGNEWLAWLPRYKQKEGLVWERKDGETMTDRQFRQHLLITQPSTAITPTSDTAEEGTLREFELISPWWRSSDGTTAPQPVGLVGYVFCQNNGLWNQLQDVKELFVGGDTRYGLGHLARQGLNQVSSFFLNLHVNLSGPDPLIESQQLLAHTVAHTAHITGALECVSGWDMANRAMLNARLLWAPGSRALQERHFCIDQVGSWEITP